MIRPHIDLDIVLSCPNIIIKEKINDIIYHLEIDLGILNVNTNLFEFNKKDYNINNFADIYSIDIGPVSITIGNKNNNNSICEKFSFHLDLYHYLLNLGESSEYKLLYNFFDY